MFYANIAAAIIEARRFYEANPTEANWYDLDIIQAAASIGPVTAPDDIITHVWDTVG